MALDLPTLKNDIDALRQNNQQNADTAWNAFRDGLAAAIEKYVKTGEYNFVGGPGQLLSTPAGQPVLGTFKVKLT